MTFALAVIGAGDVAQRDYLPHMGRLADLGHVALLCARDPARTADVAARFGIPRWTTDLGEVLGAGIDAAVNLTPVAAHAAVNLALARAQKPFWSEKPLAASLAEARAVVTAAAAPIAAAPAVLVFPQVAAAARLLAADAIGPVHSLRAAVATPPAPWAGYVGDHAPFFAAGVGPLSDLGVYPLHAIAGLFGPVARVAAASRRTRDAFAVTEGPFAGTTVPVAEDDDWHLILRLASGVTATLHASFAADLPVFGSLDIAGEAGTLTLSLLDPGQPLRLWRGGMAEDIAVAHARTDGPDHVLGVQDLLLALRDRRPPRLGPALALHALAVREAAARAARSGTFEPVETP
jgi:predicted dehydrogenase